MQPYRMYKWSLPAWQVTVTLLLIGLLLLCAGCATSQPPQVIRPSFPSAPPLLLQAPPSKSHVQALNRLLDQLNGPQPSPTPALTPSSPSLPSSVVTPPLTPTDKPQ